MSKIGSLAKRIRDYIVSHPIEFALCVAMYAALLIIFLISLPELNARFHYELSDIASCDANLYFTVGRAMGEGYRPYIDYYENKPPMIFLLIEISYRWTGYFALVNVDSFLCCLNLLLCAFAIGPIIGWRRGWKALPTALATCLIGSAGILFMTYAEAKSGEIMTEIFGVSALMDMFVCLLLLPKEGKITIFDARVILAGVFLGIAVMFKEPFGLLGVVALLFFLEKKGDVLSKLVYPLFYCVGTIFLILLISRAIPGYFTIYLSNMLGHHIETYGSLWDRMVRVDKLFTNLNSYCWELKAMVIGFLSLSAVRGLFFDFDCSKPAFKIPLKLVRAVLPIIYLYIASLCVGLGGQYFWHHYAFALPFYYLVLIDSAILVGELANQLEHIEFKKGNGSEIAKSFGKPLPLLAMAFTMTFSIIAGHGLATHSYSLKEDSMIAITALAKKEAKYVDDILDALNESNYLYIGFNGDSRLYCYTKHLPLGPCFAQDPNNFYSEDTFFVKEFMEDLHEADVIVLRSYKHGVMQQEIKSYVAANFTKNSPEATASLEPPEGFRYTVYYRNGAF